MKVLYIFFFFFFVASQKQAAAANVLFFSSSPSSSLGGESLATTVSSDTMSFEYFGQEWSGSIFFNLILPANPGWMLAGYALCLNDRSADGLSVGIYNDCEKFNPTGNLGAPGLLFSRINLLEFGTRVYPNAQELSGSFTIHELSFNSGIVDKLAIDFIQYDGRTVDRWITGGLRYNSNYPVPEPATLILLSTAFGFVLRRKRLQ